MRFSLNRISIVSFCLFVISISLDPTGTIFRVKESMFVFCFFISFFYQETKKAISRDIQLILWFCLLLPIWGIMVSLIRNNLEDIYYAFGHFKSFLFIFIFFFLRNLNFEEINKVLFINGNIIAICTILIFIIAQINPNLFSVLYDQSIENANIIISRREYYGLSILGIYFKAGPLMFFSYIYSLYFSNKGRLKFVFILLNLFALLIAGSRTPTLMVIMITIFFVYDNVKINRFFRNAFLFVCFFSLMFLTYMLATEKGDASNAVKYNDFNSYIKNIFIGINPFVGAGLGSVFWGEGRGVFHSSSEQTYMDIIRIYGAFVGFFLILLVYYPILVFLHCKYRHILKYQRFILAYFLYMILAGTNPLLINSTGMLVWAIGLTLIYKIKTNQLIVDK